MSRATTEHAIGLTREEARWLVAVLQYADVNQLDRRARILLKLRSLIGRYLS